MTEIAWGDDDIIDLPEAAVRLGLAHGTLTQYRWATRRRPPTDRQHVGFPEPDIEMPGKPLWRWSTLRDWAQATQRGRFAVTAP